MVPGFNLTGPAKFPNGTSTGNIYPDFTRVNDGKYVVSDVRAHVATSNLVWDYFYVTAGLASGLTHLPLFRNCSKSLMLTGIHHMLSQLKLCNTVMLIQDNKISILDNKQ